MRIYIEGYAVVLTLPRTVYMHVALLGVEDRDRLLKEVSLMVTFSHPNVMPLTGLSLDGETPLIIMPFMTKGNLLRYVREHKDTLFVTDTKDQKKVSHYFNSLNCYKMLCAG